MVAESPRDIGNDPFASFRAIARLPGIKPLMLVYFLYSVALYVIRFSRQSGDGSVAAAPLTADFDNDGIPDAFDPCPDLAASTPESETTEPVADAYVKGGSSSGSNFGGGRR